MSPTIEEIRIELNALFKDSAEKAMKVMADTQEEIVIAFCAKYGLHPEECISVYQDNKFWVEKKSDEHIEKITHGRHKSVDSIVKTNKKLLAFVKYVEKESLSHIHERWQNQEVGARARSLLKEIGELNA